VRDDAGKHLKKLKSAIGLCIEKITDYINFSIDAFAEEKRSIALEKKTATNNVKKAGAKASQELKGILKEIETREHGNELLAESFQDLLGNPLKKISNQLMKLHHDLESCCEKAWNAHFEAAEARSRGDDLSNSSRSSVSSRGSLATVDDSDDTDDDEDLKAKKFSRQHDAMRKNLRSSTKSSRKSTDSKSS
jgi:hypothetical protein